MGLRLLAALFLLVTPASAQLPSADTLIPKGFTLESEKDIGGVIMIEAKKPNEKFPALHADHGIKLSVVSRPMPLPQQVMDMMLSQPEEPAKRNSLGSGRTEPCGKQRYKDGILVCQRSIVPWIGAGTAPDLVTLNVTWIGKSVNIEVSNFVGSKEAAVGYIDSVLKNMSGGASPKPSPAGKQ